MIGVYLLLPYSCIPSVLTFFPLFLYSPQSPSYPSPLTWHSFIYSLSRSYLQPPVPLLVLSQHPSFYIFIPAFVSQGPPLLSELLFPICPSVSLSPVLCLSSPPASLLLLSDKCDWPQWMWTERRGDTEEDNSPALAATATLFILYVFNQNANGLRNKGAILL